MRALLIPIALLLAAPAHAQEPIRIWGPAAMRGMVERWTEAYRRGHPGATFAVTLKGSDTAIPGLYGGVADIALMGRENDGVDDNGFSRTMEYRFTRIEIANGAVSAPGKSDAIGVLVSKDNPLSGVTLAQLASVMDCGKGGAAATWGAIGLGGAWANAPIRIYSYDLASRTGRYFQHVVMQDSRRMCWDRISEYGDARRFDGTIARAAERIGTAARADRFALAIANPGEARNGLKLLKLEGVSADEAGIVSRLYPLGRRIFAFVDRKPGTALRPDVAAFLRWALGPEGQGLVRQDGGYLPLDAATAAAQIKVVDAR